MQVLVDGDVFVYRCAFACEKVYYAIKVDDEWEEFDSHKEMKAWCEDKDVPCKDYKSRREIEPEANAIKLVDIMLTKLVRRYEQPNLTVVLSGKENFRNDVAVTKEYKGSRKNVRKPEHYKAVQKHLVDNWQAYYTDGYEADDELGMLQWEEWKYDPEGTVIVTNDKDLRMIPGLHYDPVEDKQRYVNQTDADLFFCAQALAGDSTDDIPGFPGIGMAKAQKLLKDMKPGRAMETVRCTYNEEFEGGAMFEEQATLVWILREKDKNYNDYWRQQYGIKGDAEEHSTVGRDGSTDGGGQEPGV